MSAGQPDWCGAKELAAAMRIAARVHASADLVSFVPGAVMLAYYPESGGWWQTMGICSTAKQARILAALMSPARTIVLSIDGQGWLAEWPNG